MYIHIYDPPDLFCINSYMKYRYNDPVIVLSLGDIKEHNLISLPQVHSNSRCSSKITLVYFQCIK